MTHRRSLTRSPSPARQAGMSLIEIIIVIVLIGAVLTFVGSRVLGGADRAKANLAKSQVTTLAQKVESFQMDTGRLPGSLDELVTDPGNAPGWLGPYAKAQELNDPWGHPVEYRTPGESGPFDLVILGKDGKAGGTSVDGDVRYE
ncbi:MULTISPECIES: type II secretion system major pseudopilin GspG [Marilutibacter]|uniref:Type II secretion system core protein G n=2 Tax=Marilutibacter TaxID=3382698 RepID=A0A507ZRF9_9GAMM|nr:MULTISPECIES: type II secretion system major pseudopilin GspG [Lysobacter]MBB1059070.1 type II secretion system major pseudopilin GspG [Lysobacter spongiae]TQD39959.1 type II secretion system protein GspG [Lysobacter aestuarii]